LLTSTDTVGAYAFIPKAEDANTVAHVYFNGTELKDTKNNPWLMQGTVPQGTSTLFTTSVGFAGPFGVLQSSYYYLAVPHVFNFTGDFTVCAMYKAPPSLQNNYVWSHDCTLTRKGSHCVSLMNNGQIAAYMYKSTSPNYITLAYPMGAYSVNNIYSTCVGRKGTTGYHKTNLLTTQTAAMGGTAGSSSPSTIMGLGNLPANGQNLLGELYELYATTTGFDETTVTALQTAALAKIKP
jgi:hypothetical protein